MSPTPEVAEKIRAAAVAQGVPVSSVIDDLVQAGLRERKAASDGTARSVTCMKPVGDVPKSPARRTRTNPDGPKSTIVTAADAPESVRKLLKSYEPKKLRWRVRNDRHEIVVTVLTRGNAQAKRWLWTVLSRSDARELVREYRGAGCAEPDRALLRKQLDLTMTDIPTRPYLGFGT